MLEINKGILILHDNVPYWTALLKHLLKIICSYATRDAVHIDLREHFILLVLRRRHSSAASTSWVTSSASAWGSRTSTLAWGRSSNTPSHIFGHWGRSRIFSSALFTFHTLTTLRAVSFSLLFFIGFHLTILLHLHRFGLPNNLRVLFHSLMLFWLVSWWRWSRSWPWHILITNK